MRILLIGDIVGRPGRVIVQQALQGLKQREQIDFVVANGENAAGGSGITPEIFRELIAAGVDCVTLGDHIYKRFEIATVLNQDARIVKPANFPDEAPGKRWTVLSAPRSISVAVVSLLGRVFMKPVDCPFAAAERAMAEIPANVKVRIIDFHAEATSDKQLMGRLLDGRASAVLGTHTHVATADEQIFPGGTAFQCDVGMTGPHESILGRRIDRVMETTMTFRPTHFDIATGDVRLCGTLVEIDETTGKATGIRRLMVSESDALVLAKQAAS